MRDYANRVVDAASRLPEPLTLVGWSMGGLVAMMAAERAGASFLVVIEPSPPAEVQGFDPSVVVPTSGTFDPERAYGRFPAGVPARAESAVARAERKRGISVSSVPCPTLVVYGDEFPEERGRAVAHRYRAEALHLAGLDHWRLVLDPRVPQALERRVLV